MLRVENNQQTKGIRSEEILKQQTPDSPLIQCLQMLQEPPELIISPLFELNTYSRGPQNVSNQNFDFWTYMKQLQNFDISFKNDKQKVNVFTHKIHKDFKHFKKQIINRKNKKQNLIHKKN